MASAAEFLDEVIRTPAFKGAHRRLIEVGTWVAREEFDAMAHSPMAMDHALSDLVMLGLVEFQPAAGYRLAAGALERQVARRLLLSGRDREVVARMRGDALEVGVAVRVGDEVALGRVVVGVPSGVSGAAAAQWAADAVCGSFGGEVGHG